MKKNKSLREQIIVSFGEISKRFSDCPPRSMSNSTVSTLRAQIKIDRVDLRANQAYRQINNLSESKVLGCLLLK